MAGPLELLKQMKAAFQAARAAEPATGAARVGVNPELLSTYNLQVHSPAGVPLGPVLTAEQLRALESAQPILRRKSVSDLSSPRLGNVHSVQKSGAAAGWKKSREVRQEVEPALFGSTDVVYGALVRDPLATLRAPLELAHPERGVPVIKPTSVLSQYGGYGFVPRDRAKLTFTLDDSLDHSRGVAMGGADSTAGMADGHYDGNALGELLKAYHGERRAAAERLGLPSYSGEYYARDLPAELRGLPWHASEREAFEAAARGEFARFESEYPASFGARAAPELGLKGLPGYYRGQDAMARLVPRRFGEIGPPLSPLETMQLQNLNKYLSGGQPYGYYEVQGHGLTPADIGRVIDYHLEPSSALERKLKKLGIEYEAAPVAGTPLEKLNRAAGAGASVDELRGLASDLGQDQLARGLGYIKAAPRVAENYARGGLAQIKGYHHG